jgi:TolB-like protein/class 3 adenylate cyclase/rhodanese-related sulfurtransferase
MPGDSVEQRLAAILAADVAGYTQLMRADEVATLAALDAARAIFRTEIESEQGRVVDMAGDSVLAVFQSATGAVRAALAVQRALAEAEEHADSGEDAHMRFRIGVNLGDVMEKADGTVYGDGINVASRLESLAEPGGIMASEDVQHQAAPRLAAQFIDAGSHEVKNVPHPIRAFRVLPEGVDAGETKSEKSRKTMPRNAIVGALSIAIIATVAYIWLVRDQTVPTDPGTAEQAISVEDLLASLPDKPSIAVLPFANLSDDQEQEYLADGMTEDLITDLSKISDLFVIARNSTFTYKNKPTKVQTVAADLKVRYVLEGSIRRTGDNVRINAQLIDAVAGNHIWAERYDGDFSGVFQFQDKVVAQIVENLAAHLTEDKPTELAVADTEVPQAYDAYLQGRELLRKRNAKDSYTATKYFDTAIALDPGFSRAYAGLAAAYWNDVVLSWSSAIGSEWQHAYDKAVENLAIALENPTPEAYALSADILARQGHLDRVVAEIDRAIALAPSNADFHVTKARVLNLLGRAEEAEASVRIAMQHDPHFVPDYLRVLGISLFHQRKYEAAIDLINRVISLQPKAIVDDYVTLLSAYGHLGRADDIATTRAEVNKLTELAGAPLITVQYAGFWWYGILYDYDPDYREHLLAGLRKAGLDEGVGDPLRYTEYKAMISSPEDDYDVAGATKIDAVTAKVMRDSNALFVDVRPPGAFSAGRVPGSRNLELSSELSEEALLSLADKDEDVVFSCWGKYCPFAAFASAKALAWGWTRVYYFAGGFPAWQDAGFDVESDTGF